MNQLPVILQSLLSVIIVLISSADLQASQAATTFTPPEVAVGTVSCKAEWNQFCEDQKIIKVPDGHKLCNNLVSAKEQTGDSAYEIVSTDNQSVTVKFHAKGNRDRLKQQGASIVLNISLLGVRENVDCISGAMAKPAATPIIDSKTAAVTDKKTTPISEITPEVKAPEVALPVQPQTTPIEIKKASEAKPDACACSQWIDADKVFNCLANGHGRDNAKCDSYATTIQCVASKEDCRESQKENCPQVAGLNQTTSKKRIFVPDSPYCQQP